MEIQDDHKIQTETKILDDLQQSPYELSLLNDLQKAQIKTKEDVDKKELKTWETQADWQKLPDHTYIKDDNAVKTSDDELIYDNERFANVITKMKAFMDKAKQRQFEKNILIDEWEIFNDFFNLIEKHKTNFTDKDQSIVSRGLKLFIDAADTVDPNVMFTTDLAYAKEIFYLYFNLINFDFIQNYLKNASMSDHLKISCRICICRILTVMRHASSHTDLGLNDLQRPINCIEMLSSMLNYIKTYFESLDLTSDVSSIDTLITCRYIIRFMCYYAENTIMVSDLIEVGCLEMIVNGLAITCKTAKTDYELQEYLIATIFTIGFHDDGIKQLNALNTVDLIKAFLSNNVNTDLNILGCATLALLSTPEQIKKGGKYMNDVLDILLKMVSDASVSSDYSTGTNYRLSELLIVFVKLFNDDRTLNYIMQDSQVDLHVSSTIEFFVNLLINYYSTVGNEDPRKHAVCTALVNMLWSISFQEKYKQKLKNSSTKFKELITNLTREADEQIAPNHYVPQYIESIHKAAEGLLFNIGESIHPVTEQIDGVLTIPDNNKKPMIMISYAHKDADFCKQLYNELEKRGYEIWIDFKFLKTGDLWETIAAGMKQATVIVCLISEDYYKSKSCRMEATYALDKLQANKSVIPVLLRKNELPEWLEIRISSLKYVLFRDLTQLEHDKLFELIDMIQHSVSSTLPDTNRSVNPPIGPVDQEPMTIPITKVNEPTLHSSHIFPVQTKSIITKLENQDNSSNNDPLLCATTDQNLYSKKPIEEWNTNDILQWFQHNEIISELRDLCHFKDGNELLIYAKIFLDTEKLQYQMYSDEFLRRDGITFGKRPLLLHEFTKFSNALRKLEKFNK